MFVFKNRETMKMNSFKKIVFATVLLVSATGLQAQNKIYDKYADMKDIHYYCVNESMMQFCNAAFGALASQDGSTNVCKLQKMLTISSTQRGAVKKINADIKKLLGDKNYEVLANGRSEGGMSYNYLLNETDSPNELVICTSSDNYGMITVVVGHFSKKEISDVLGNN